MISKSSSINEDALLEEYRSCDERVGRLDSLMWQTAAIIFPISLAGFAFFGVLTTQSKGQFLITLAAGIGSIALLLTWFQLSKQWYVYQRIAFYRMREIEPILGLWQYRYAAFVRASRIEREAFLQTLNDSEKDRFRELDSAFVVFHRIGLQRAMRVITILFIAGWVALIFREFFLAFFK